MADEYKSRHRGTTIDDLLSSVSNPDTTPTAGSQSLITSGGVHSALTQKADSSALSVLTQKITDIESVVPDVASPSNKLADKNFVSSSILGKQDAISDLDTIRLGASKGATAYQKPGSGIPKSDLEQSVRSSLDRADSALQTHQSLENYYTKSEVNSLVGDKYTRPSTGIPKSDLAIGIQESLGRADTAIQSHQDLTPITSLIPNAASSINQLADKAFVNSSIASSSSVFRGTSQKGLTEQQFLAWADTLTANTNDYIYWDTVDGTGNAQFKRYKYNGSSWVYEYTLNNSSFTSDEWAAIKSGITSALVDTFRNKYDKPSAGIPAADLHSTVRTSLGKADTALQSLEGLVSVVNNTLVITI